MPQHKLDPEEKLRRRRAREKQYYQAHKAQKLAASKEYDQKHPERREYMRDYSKKWYAEHREEQLRKGKEREERRRRIVIEHYSDGENCCACCGESHMIFLTIDHLNNDGYKKINGKRLSGMHLYRWLIENNYPSGFQVLCRNCNWAKHALGRCPHESK